METNQEELNIKLDEAYNHLMDGRYRMALNLAEEVIQYMPQNDDVVICYAWALLENGFPAKAMEFANLAVDLKSNNLRSRFFRAYLLTRLSIYEGALSDIDKTIEEQKSYLSQTYVTKARALAGLKKFEEAAKALELGIIIDNGKNEHLNEIKDLLRKIIKLFKARGKLTSSAVSELIKDCEDAIEKKEYWFSLHVSRKLLEDAKLGKEKYEVALIELESMFYLFQYKPAFKKAEALKNQLKNNHRFNFIFNRLLSLRAEEPDYEETFTQKKSESGLKMTGSAEKQKFTQEKFAIEKEIFRTDSLIYPNKNADVFSVKVFDADKEKISEERKYYLQFENKIKKIGVEVIFSNPFFESADKNFLGTAVWYLNDFEIYRNEFRLNIKRDWESVIFAQYCGDEGKNIWKVGQGKVEIYLNNFKICEKYFGISHNVVSEEIEEKLESVKEQPDQKTGGKGFSYQLQKPVPEKTIEELLAELDKFVGLTNIKRAVRDMISLLEFQKERKKHGLKSDERIIVNAVFTGNPGTGKTSVARLIGQILFTMGILPKGHVVEVDRSALVGQYIGETAQKTEKVINDAMGGVLFIDEAYTLFKKESSSQDFGQETIDILLKRMEDHKGEFAVIVAGYPEEMSSFLSSNPGLKSRFNYNFHFEDFTPEELVVIFQNLLAQEEYKITEEAKKEIEKEFILLYRNRDKSFGNARLTRKLLEECKINLSKRCLALNPEERTKEILTTLTIDDIKNSLRKEKAKEVKLPINEEALQEALTELQSMVGLESVKKEIMEIVKLVRFYLDEGENVKEKFSSHILFLGNPGTGKTTVARIFSRIYSALGILSKGHLVETDRQGLVAGYVGQTSEKTSALIDKAIGGTLFIDEAYSLTVKGTSESDFGKEAIDILLKRMEDDRGKFLVIAAGYTDEMQDFVNSNPGIKSRFHKSFVFEDYNPNELMEIVERSLKKEKKNITAEARNELLRYFVEIYRTRDKKFGNARIVRNILETVKNKMILRIAELPKAMRTDEVISTITFEDIKEVVSTKEQAKEYEVKGDPLKLQEYIYELNRLTGLENVKQGVYKLMSGLKVAQLRKERGLQVIEKNLNCVFMGNPGTGKTTIARLMSKIFKELGLLEKGHLIEVDRSNLVAGYQGQTAIKTDQVIKQALGGTLFIDEAYTLARGSNDFGLEAIDTLLKRIEDYNGQLAVILAGYTDEMKLFIESNPGLQSRFPNLFVFEDYDPRQLLGITVDIAENSGYRLDEGALQSFLDVFSEIYSQRDRSFGNARTAKNLLYKAISNQEERISKLKEYSNEDLMTITLDDVQSIVL